MWRNRRTVAAATAGVAAAGAAAAVALSAASSSSSVAGSSSPSSSSAGAAAAAAPSRAAAVSSSRVASPTAGGASSSSPLWRSRRHHASSSSSVTSEVDRWLATRRAALRAVLQGGPVRASAAGNPSRKPRAPKDDLTDDGKPGKFDPTLPTFTLAEVEKHSSPEAGMWVVFGRGVYDATPFIANHPGGARILLAGGKSVEPFWAIFQNHHEEHVYEILSELRIGNLAQEDYDRMQEEAAAAGDASDPYANDPHSERNIMLNVRNQKPFCAEPDPSVVLATYITHVPLHYIRNHMPVPDIKAEDYKLEVVGPTGQKHYFTLNELKEKFPKHTITATLQCVGNRAQSLKKEKQVGTFYGTAISTSVWAGARLRDVLKAVGTPENGLIEGEEDEDGEPLRMRWVNLEAADTDGVEPFGGCIPFEKGMSYEGDTLLAYEMNGEPIPRDHGYPVRLLAPGYVGVRNLKWVQKVEVSSKESESSNWKAEKANMGQRLMEWPVNSYIVEPARGQVLNEDDEFFEAKGWAFSGGGRSIERVEVSWDFGRTWHECDLDKGDEEQPVYQSWAWTHWSRFISMSEIRHRGPQGKVELRVRAYDASYNSQPEFPPQEAWVDFGCVGNPIHKVPITLKEGVDGDDKLKRRLRFIFNTYDTDRNGVLTVDELYSLIQAVAAIRGERLARDPVALNAVVQETFEAIDLDHNGEIDFEEFAQAVKGNKLSIAELFVNLESVWE